LELIHMVLHISKTYDEFMSIIINWGWSPEKSYEGQINLRLRKSITGVRKNVPRKPKLQQETRFDNPKTQ
jgi:hypothetical protein